MDLQQKFKDLFEPGLIKEIESQSTQMSVPAGGKIIGVGDTIQAVPIVLSGVVKISRTDKTGKELLLYYVNSQESCAMTFTCCMQDKVSGFEALAEEDVELLVIPVGLNDVWLSKYTTWKSYVMNTIQIRFEEMLNCIDNIAFQKLDERLINYLKEKSRVTDSKLINLSHEQIASELSSNRVVISRLLKKLENDKKLLLYFIRTF